MQGPTENHQGKWVPWINIIIIFIITICSEDSDFSLKSEEMCEFFDKCGYPASVVQAGHHRAQQIDRQSALQMSQKENNNRIPFTLTFHPHNHAVKSIILKNYKLLQNDPDTGRIFSQPPLISFKCDKNIGVMYIDINVRPLETGHFVALQLSLI